MENLQMEDCKLKGKEGLEKVTGICRIHTNINFPNCFSDNYYCSRRHTNILVLCLKAKLCIIHVNKSIDCDITPNKPLNVPQPHIQKYLISINLNGRFSSQLCIPYSSYSNTVVNLCFINNSTSSSKGIKTMEKPVKFCMQVCVLLKGWNASLFVCFSFFKFIMSVQREHLQDQSRSRRQDLQ